MYHDPIIHTFTCYKYIYIYYYNYEENTIITKREVKISLYIYYHAETKIIRENMQV
jgi:hypothetical protein